MDINLTLIGQSISMILFVWFCMKFIWPPLMEAIEERQAQIADGLAMGGIGALRGYKDTFGPMKIMALSYWGIGLPVGVVLSTTNLIVEPMQAVGMWIGISLGLLVAATLMVLRVKETSNRFINEQQS